MKWQIVKILVLCVIGKAAASAIHDAASKGDLVLVKKLVESDSSVVNEKDSSGFTYTPRGDTPLVKAAKFGHYDVAKYLLDNGAKVGPPNIAAIKAAADEGYPDIVQLLIDYGTPVNVTNGFGALALLSNTDKPDVVRVFLKNGALISEFNLFKSLRLAYIESFHLFVEYGANVNALDVYGNDLISVAISNHLYEEACYLVEKGIGKDYYGDIEGKCFWDGSLYDVGEKWNDGKWLMRCEKTCSVTKVKSDPPAGGHASEGRHDCNNHWPWLFYGGKRSDIVNQIPQVVNKKGCC